MHSDTIRIYIFRAFAIHGNKYADNPDGTAMYRLYENADRQTEVRRRFFNYAWVYDNAI